MQLILKLCILCSLLPGIFSSRILAVFSVPSISHQIVYRALTDELAARGHELVIATPDPVEHSDRTGAIRQIDLHDISYGPWREMFKQQNKKTNIIDMVNAMVRIWNSQLSQPDFANIIGNGTEHFDAVLVEQVYPINQIFGWRFKAPIVGIHSMGASFLTLRPMGLPHNPTIYEDSFSLKVGELSVWDKIKQLYVHGNVLRDHRGPVSLTLHAIAKKHFGAEAPSVLDLESSVDVELSNSFTEVAGVRPVTLAYNNLGGLHLHGRLENKLSQDIAAILESSSQGVIYASFGSNVMGSALPPKFVNSMLNVFRSINYSVILKWDEDYLPGKPDNVFIFKWLPQLDILMHPHVKLFLTHGGQQSMEEAIMAGVPLVGIPFFGDQFANVAKFEKFKIGVQLNSDSLSENTLKNAINQVLSNESIYRQNLDALSRRLLDQPATSLERAVWWTEYAIRHSGASHLRAPNCAVLEYLMLDVALVCVAVVACVCCAVWMTLRVCLERLRKKFKTH